MSEEDALLHKQDDGGSEETVDRSWLGDYKEDPSFQNYKDLNSVLKTFKNQESMLGERIKIPKDESNDDEYNKFVSKTRPKAIEDYGIDIKDDNGKALLQTLYDNGLTKRQANSLMKTLTDVGARETELSKQQSQQARDKAYQKLVETLGDESKVEDTLKEVNMFLDKTVGKKYPDFMDFIRETNVKVGEEDVVLANHPAMIQALKVMVDMVSDDNKDIKGAGAASQEDLSKQWLDVVSKMAESKHDKTHPEYVALQQEKARIQKLLDQTSG